MTSNPDDDFGAFRGSEHMFYGLREPFSFIRTRTEASLRMQVPDTTLDAIKTLDQAKFLTLGRRNPDGRTMVVTHFGFAVLSDLYVTYDAGRRREIIRVLSTFLFGEVDQPGAPRCKTYFDVHDEADARFTDETLKERFLGFRVEQYAGEPSDPPPRRPWWKFWG